MTQNNITEMVKAYDFNLTEEEVQTVAKVILYNVARYKISNSDDIIMQTVETLPAVVSRYDEKRGTKLSSYICRAMINNIANFARYERKRLHDEYKEDNGKFASDIAIECVRRDEYKRLYDAVKQLSEREQTVIIGLYGLYKTPEKTTQQLAEALQISRQSVYNIKARAIKRLRAYLIK